MGFLHTKKENSSKKTSENNIDELLEGYIDSLESLREASQSDAQNKFDTYHALVRLGSSREPENGEADRQAKLLEKLRKKGKYEYILGRNSKGKATFCQVITNGYQVNDEKEDVEKLYINCERDKVADIVSGILKGCDKQKTDISMKFVYEDGKSNNYLRNDKIVIYCEDDAKKGKILSIINQLVEKQPKLFNADKKIPFMPKSNECNLVFTPGVVQKGRYTTYKSTGGNLNRLVVNTYNNILAEALQESFVVATSLVVDKSYAENDESKGGLLFTGERMKTSLDTFYRLDEASRKEIVGIMKKVLPGICEVNNINIDSNLIIEENKMELPLNDLETAADFYNTADNKRNVSKQSREVEEP